MTARRKYSNSLANAYDTYAEREGKTEIHANAHAFFAINKICQLIVNIHYSK